MSEEALQKSEEKREVKGKRERERYTELNAEFHRIARRDKKAFLNEQCKEIEEKVEWERLEISSRKLEISREHFTEGWAPSRAEMVRTKEKQKRLSVHRRTVQKRS